ncbi:cilia- and flagella-associated protein 77 [Symphorus nematophorus]
MSSPRLGVVRKSILTNPRIIKAPLGHSRSSGLSVPGPDFTFGISSQRDGGVAEVLSSWTVQPRHEDPAPVSPDFVSLNRDAVRSGVVTSKELSQYRAQRGGALTTKPAPKQREASVPEITFGISSRPSTPMADVLSHQYGRRWIEEQRFRDQTSPRNDPQRIKPGCVLDTKTSLMRRSSACPAQLPVAPFKLPQFSQVPAALDTFRDPEARERAVRAHQLDRESGRGIQSLN